MSETRGAGATGKARPWSPPSIDAPPGPVATAGGLADLQAEAYREAFEQGLAEGRTAGRAAARVEVERLDGVLQGLARPLADIDAAVERELLALAVALARQIVRRELKTDPTQIIGIVRDAIAALPVASRDVRVKLHPEDAAVVRGNLAPTERERAWTIVEDPVMTRGGCEVVTSTSRIDARLESRIGAILSDLLGTDRQGPSGREVDG
jgi:flagellar assembly protein FliH